MFWVHLSKENISVMETTNTFRIKTMQSCIALVLLSCSLMGCYEDEDNQVDRPYTISGDANGSQMVPPVIGTGTGTGTISGSYDPVTRQLTYTSEWTGLTGPPNSGGLYTGAAGSSGTIVGSSWSFDPNITGSGSRTGLMTLTAEEETQLTSGNWYYSYGTIANPNGEVRGQISATR